MNHFIKAATQIDIAAVGMAATRLDMTQLPHEIGVAVAPYGLSALLECTLAEQPTAVTPMMRARLYQEAARRIATLEMIEGEAALYA